MIPFRHFPPRLHRQPGLPPIQASAGEKTTEVTRKRKNPDDPSETVVTKTTIRPFHPDCNSRARRSLG